MVIPTAVASASTRSIKDCATMYFSPGRGGQLSSWRIGGDQDGTTFDWFP
jgi:hypothetical protein